MVYIGSMWLESWQSLIGVGVGGGITWLVSWSTRRNANQREDERWERERRREEENSKRQQELLTYEHRREAYAGFIGTWRKAWEKHSHPDRVPGPAPSDFLDDVWEQRSLIALYGTKEAEKLCWDAYDELIDYVYLGRDEDSGGLRSDQALGRFITVVRRDLAVPD